MLMECCSVLLLLLLLLFSVAVPVARFNPFVCNKCR